MTGKLAFLIWIALLISPASLQAGATMYYHPSNGTPLQWQADENGKATIHYIVDAGGLGRLTHDQAIALLQAAMEVWEAAANVEFVYDGTTDQIIDDSNYRNYLVVDETICTDNCTDLENAENSYQLNRISVIGFDNTSESIIIDDTDGMSGSGNSYGITNITSISGTNADPDFITSAQIIFNGATIDGLSTNYADLTVNRYAAVMVHELGHFIGLDHTSVNQVLVNAIDTGELDETEYARFIPTMESQLVIHADQTTLNPDDIAAAQALYPFSNTATVSGNTTDSNENDFRGAQMELRSIDDPLCEAYSFISGKQCTPLYLSGGGLLSGTAGSRCGNDENPSVNTGQFFLRAIPAGTYVLSAQEVIDDYKGGVIHPFSTEFPIPELVGDAEFYNDTDLASEDYSSRTSLTLDGTTDLSDLTLTLSSSTADADGSENLIPINFFSTTNGFENSLTATSSRCQPNTIDYAALIGVEELVDDGSDDDDDDGNNTSSPTTGGCSLIQE